MFCDEQYEKVLKDKFGYDSFKEYQLKIIRNVIEDQRDQFVMMPTSDGKSSCFQFPSIFIDKSITIVISPLHLSLKTK